MFIISVILVNGYIVAEEPFSLLGKVFFLLLLGLSIRNLGWISKIEFWKHFIRYRFSIFSKEFFMLIFEKKKTFV